MPRSSSLRIAGLPGLVVMPERPTALYVLAHGAGAGMKHRFLARLAEALAGANLATLRWEFPYMAAGKARPDSPAVAEAAVRSVWLAAREKFAGLPMFAGGKSFGGRMTSRAHAKEPLPALAGLAFLGFPLHPPERPGIERAEHLARAKGKLLFLSGDRDDLAQLALLRPVVASLGRRARLHVVEHADHGFEVRKRSGRTDEDVMAELVRELARFCQVRTRQLRSEGMPEPTPRR